VAAAFANDGAAVQEHAGKPGILTRLFAYLGGVFVFAGIGIFIAMQWSEMNSAARVVVTLGSGLASFVMAFVATKDARFAGAITPLFLIAAILEPVGIVVVLDEYASGGNWQHASLLTNGVMLAQQLLVLVATRRTALLFTSLSFGSGFVATGMDLYGVQADLIAATIGASLLSITIGLTATAHRVIAPFWFFVASVLLLGGLFGLLRATALEVGFLGAACAMVYLSTHVRSRSVLVVATIAILSYIGYFTNRNFVDTIGWPIALMTFGFVMIGLSAVAVMISRRYIRAGVGRQPPAQ
jgi:hypothetical protein